MRWLAIVALVGLPFVWFTQLDTESDGPFTCTTGLNMAQVIDAAMRDARVHVDRVRVVESDDDRFESLFLTSARVRAAGVYVGIGTWASNFSGVGGDPARVTPWPPVVPVNELARAISVRRGSLRSPGMTAAAGASQHCVGAP